jgi:hypothetical protein
MNCTLISTLSAGLTPLIAMITVYIAWQQFRTNRNKLRLDLYDRRFGLYAAFANLCSSVGASMKPGSEELNRFLQVRHATQFLFDPETAAYMEAARVKAVRLQYLDTLLGGRGLPIGDDRTKAAKEQSELVTWFTAQFDESRAHFARYLHFK